VDGNKLDRPSGVTISPDGQFAYASSYRDGYINVYALDSTIAVPAIEKIFWVETDRVGSINKDGSGDIETVASGLEIGYSIAVDQDGGKVYWADRVSNKISRSNVDGSDVEDIYAFNSSSRPFTIALDVAAGDIYFASPDTKTIKRGKMDGSAAPVVIYDSADASAAPNNSSNPGIRDVRGIALDVAAGMIYWTDRGTGDDRVVRGTMDGTMTPQLLYIQVSGSAQDIALDIDAGMLYWANSGRGQIERAKMDGSGDRITVYSGSHTGGWPTGLALDVAEGNLYWSANKDDTIRLGKMDGQTSPDSTPIVLVSGVNNPNDIELASVGGSGNSGGGDPVDEAPVITLLGDNPLQIECGTAYSDPGATASDDLDGDISGSIVVDASAVNTSVTGSYVVAYDVSDSGGNAAEQVTRTVEVVDTTAPVIALNGDASMTLECGIGSYQELGATATDACDPNVSVVIGGDTVNPNALGGYTVTYNAVDASGNVAAQVVRTVTVVDTTAPVITLLGDSLVVLECRIDTYAEDGASVFDACDGGVQVVVAGSVDTDSPGTYQITYDAVDGFGNEADQVVRTVIVEDTIAPFVAIIGSSDVVLLQHDFYVEEGATVADECDANVTVVTDNSAVDTASIGVFTVTYDAVDASGNNAIIQSRTVTVLPRFAALDALFGCAELKLEEDAIVDGTIGGMSSIQLHKKSLVTGDVFNVLGDVQVHQDAQVGGVVDAGGKVTLHKESSAGAVVSGQRVDLKKNAQVSGDVVSAADVKLSKGASVGGVVGENQIVTPMAEIQLPVLNLIAGGSDVSVGKNDSVHLAPGVYQALEAKRNSTVELVSGHYSFSEFKVERGSVLQLDLTDGPVIVDVVGELIMDGVEMSVLNGGAQDVLFQVQGDQAKLGTDEDDDEVFGAYIGTYLVANGQLMLESGATLIGAGYARSVMVKEDGLVQPEPAIDLLVEAAAQWVGMTSCFLEIEDEESEPDEGEEDDEDEDEGKKSSKRKGKN